jgi:hypothetical protein
MSDFSQAWKSFGGHLMCAEAAPVPGVFGQPSRPYLEAHVRVRGQGLPNIEIAAPAGHVGPAAAGPGRPAASGSRPSG